MAAFTRCSLRTITVIPLNVSISKNCGIQGLRTIGERLNLIRGVTVLIGFASGYPGTVFNYTLILELFNINIAHDHGVDGTVFCLQIGDAAGDGHRCNKSNADDHCQNSFHIQFLASVVLIM
ncbi:MAG: hypothetical protein IJ466_04405 [Clostridia bacterium]|nr:hypothetical protein [Clostridia bacterium]